MPEPIRHHGVIMHDGLQHIARRLPCDRLADGVILPGPLRIDADPSFERRSDKTADRGRLGDFRHDANHAAAILRADLYRAVKTAHDRFSYSRIISAAQSQCTKARAMMRGIYIRWQAETMSSSGLQVYCNDSAPSCRETSFTECCRNSFGNSVIG